jgi:hypothetical protein
VLALRPAGYQVGVLRLAKPAGASVSHPARLAGAPRRRDQPAEAAPAPERRQDGRRSGMSVGENWICPVSKRSIVVFGFLSAFEQNQSYQLIHLKQSVFTTRSNFHAADQ